MATSLFEELDQVKPKSGLSVIRQGVSADWGAVVDLADRALAARKVIPDHFGDQGPHLSPASLRFNELHRGGGFPDGRIMNLEVRGPELEELMLPVVRTLGLSRVESRLWIKMTGMIVPIHYDVYDSYKVKYPDAALPMRWVIFPENRDPGHFFEVDSDPVVSWRQGDAILLPPGVWHSSANAGYRRCLTINLTGQGNLDS